MCGMKIYYVANARMPTEKAHGIQIAKMCEAFVEEGIDLELIVPNRKTAGKSIQDFYGLRVAIPIVKLPVPNWYGYGRIGFFISSCVFAAAYFFYLLKKRIKREKGIIYTIDIDQFSFFTVPFIGMPYVVEIHDAKPLTASFRLLFRFACAIITINDLIREKLIARFRIDPKKIIVLPNGVDLREYENVPSREEMRQSTGVSPGALVVLYVGKLYDWKGINMLREVAECLHNPVYIYCLGGTREEFIRLAGGVSVPENLIFLGHCSHQYVPRFLALADVLLVLGTKANDYSYYHTSPMKLFEYMASCRPILASRTPANSAIVSEKETEADSEAGDDS